MKGMLIKEVYNLGNFKKTFISQIVIMVVFMLVFSRGMMMESLGATYVLVMTGVLMMNVINSSFACDETVSWNKYASSMPISRKTIVKAKYMCFLVCFVALNAIVVTVVALSALFAGAGEFSLMPLLTSAMGGAIMVGMMLSVSLPVAFKLGVQKARMAMYTVWFGFFGVFAVLIIILNKVAPSIIESILTIAALKWIGVVAAIVVVLALILSYFISVRVYEKREF